MAETSPLDFLLMSRLRSLRSSQIALWQRQDQMAGQLAYIQNQVIWLLQTRSATTPPSSAGPPSTPGADSLPARMSDLMKRAGEWGRRISLAISIFKAGLWIWGILLPSLLLAAAQVWKWAAPWLWRWLPGL